MRHTWQRWISSQSAAFWADYLPPGNTNGDGEAILSVVNFLRNMVKYEQNTLRNLLTITPASYQHQVARDFLQTVAEVERDITTASKIQLALLRMITAHHYLHQPPAKEFLQSSKTS
ncbi:hypothetical protein VP01_11686g1, partial [Puccinia sorghi]